MNKKDINLEILSLIVKEVESLREDLVFVGGATISLFITEPQHISIRETYDVDCAVEVSSRKEYEDISSRLRKIGFTEDIESKNLCRFKKNNLLLDLIPTDKKILGFSNQWLKEGFQRSLKYMVEEIEIRLLDLPYLIASKIDAFKGRGRGEYVYSHDIEDIITLIDGRETLAKDLSAADERVKNFLQTEFKIMRHDKRFTGSLEGHISDRLNIEGRKKIILERIDAVLSVE